MQHENWLNFLSAPPGKQEIDIAYITHSISPPRFLRFYSITVSAYVLFQDAAMLRCNPRANCLNKTLLQLCFLPAAVLLPPSARDNRLALSCICSHSMVAYSCCRSYIEIFAKHFIDTHHGESSVSALIITATTNNAAHPNTNLGFCAGRSVLERSIVTLLLQCARPEPLACVRRRRAETQQLLQPYETAIN